MFLVLLVLAGFAYNGDQPQCFTFTRAAQVDARCAALIEDRP